MAEPGLTSVDELSSLLHDGCALAEVDGVKLAGKLFARNNNASSTCLQTNCDACGCIETQLLRSSPAFPCRFIQNTFVRDPREVRTPNESHECCFDDFESDSECSCV